MPRNQTKIHGTNNWLDKLTGTSGGVGSNGSGVRGGGRELECEVVGDWQQKNSNEIYLYLFILYFVPFVLSVNIFPNNLTY